MGRTRLSVLVAGIALSLWGGVGIAADTESRSTESLSLQGCLTRLGALYYEDTAPSSREARQRALANHCAFPRQSPHVTQLVYPRVFETEWQRIRAFHETRRRDCFDKWKATMARVAERTARSQRVRALPQDMPRSQRLLVHDAMFEAQLTGAVQRRFAKDIESNTSAGCMRLTSAIAIAREHNLGTLIKTNVFRRLRSEETHMSEDWAIWLIVHHADNQPQFQRYARNRLDHLARRGHFPKPRVARLTDRLLSRRDKPLKYGTLYRCENGKAVARKLEKPGEIDARRKKMGLPPLAAWLQSETESGACR